MCHVCSTNYAWVHTFLLKHKKNPKLTLIVWGGHRKCSKFFWGGGHWLSCTYCNKRKASQSRTSSILRCRKSYQSRKHSPITSFVFVWLIAFVGETSRFHPYPSFIRQDVSWALFNVNQSKFSANSTRIPFNITFCISPQHFLGSAFRWFVCTRFHDFSAVHM